MCYSVLPKGGDAMGIFSIRLTEKEEKLFKSYVTFTGKTLSELLKTALKEKIEDKFDYEIGIKALENFEKNPIVHSIEDVIKEIENDL